MELAHMHPRHPFLGGVPTWVSLTVEPESEGNVGRWRGMIWIAWIP